jgi:type VI secretion system protein ImpA
LPGEAVPSRDGVLKTVAEAQAASPELAAHMQSGLAAVQGIVAVLEQHAGHAAGPDFAPLLELLRRVAEADRCARGDAAPVSAAEPVAGAAQPARALGAIESRDDAVRALERVCEWIERNEPSSPAPLLIRRAQRLMSKNFLDIIGDLLPDGLSQVQNLAGLRE